MSSQNPPLATLASAAATEPHDTIDPRPPMPVHYRYAEADGVKVFYREAGDPTAPTILLLHGFPTSSFMYRNLIPLLADRYHVVAPDLPGFGLTEVPEQAAYAYTFDRLATTMDAFTRALGLEHYAMQVFDYGAPVGWRLAAAHPERITAIVTQNGNAYEEGLSEGWNPIQKYWQDASDANREVVREFLSLEAIKWQYTHGVPDPSLVAPNTYALDFAQVSRPGNHDIQLDLFLDYRNNVARYPQFQAYFRTHRPPLLAVWGQHDPFFLPQGAEAFKRDLPDAEVHFYDTGHFALESHGPEIGARIRRFLDRVLTRK